MKLARRYTFSAAHHLTNVPEGHKCARSHGHTYVVWIIVERMLGPPEQDPWVMDFAQLDVIMHPLIKDDPGDPAVLDHQDLNKVLDVPTTCENIARYIAQQVWLSLPISVTGLTVRVGENDNGYAEFIWPTQ